MTRGSCGCRAAEGSASTTTRSTCYCPVDDVLDMVAKEYAIEIIGLLADDGPKRHSEIATTLDVNSSSALADRLRTLTDAGILERTSHGGVPPHVEYSLSPRGREFERRLRPLLQWAIRNAAETN